MIHIKKFYMPDTSDKRIEYAKKELEKLGYISINNSDNADFIVLGVNPEKEYLNYIIPVFAGNVSKKGVIDYTKNEIFAIKNAYLTAEAAISVAINNSDFSLINSPVLICGYGRISKALKRYLEAFTNDITICLRNPQQRAHAESTGAKTISFDELNCREYDFIFNTVPHPVFNKKELKTIKKEALLIELASFPGGVDKHFADYYKINLITAGGLPGKYSPQSAGEIVAHTIDNLIKEEGL
ncbi:MAG: hypothetical protein IJR70_01750 [Eubacterium sp.]|nr:hypothetical protein [Eubacterium sp.]